MILLLIEIKQENSQFSKIMVVSNGVSNFKRFRARLMLCYNKDCAYSLPPDGSAPRKKAGKKRGGRGGDTGGGPGPQTKRGGRTESCPPLNLGSFRGVPH